MWNKLISQLAYQEHFFLITNPISYRQKKLICLTAVNSSLFSQNTAQKSSSKNIFKNVFSIVKNKLHNLKLIINLLGFFNLLLNSF